MGMEACVKVGMISLGEVYISFGTTVNGNFNLILLNKWLCKLGSCRQGL